MLGETFEYLVCGNLGGFSFVGGTLDGLDILFYEAVPLWVMRTKSCSLKPYLLVKYTICWS